MKSKNSCVTLLVGLLLGISVISVQAKGGESGPTLYVETATGTQFKYANNKEQLILPKRSEGKKTDGYGGRVEICSHAGVLCYDGIVRFVVDGAAIDKGLEYTSGEVNYVPICIYKVGDVCELSLIKYEATTGDRKNESGFYIYDKKFGIRSFSFADPKTGRITASYSYKSGYPILGPDPKSNS